MKQSTYTLKTAKSVRSAMFKTGEGVMVVFRFRRLWPIF